MAAGNPVNPGQGQQPQGQQRQQRQNQPPKIEFEGNTINPCTTANTYDITLGVVVSQGSNAVEGRQIDFYIENVFRGSETTDENGRARFVWPDHATTQKRLIVAAQLNGTPTRKADFLAIPEKSTVSSKAELLELVPDEGYVDPHHLDTKIYYVSVMVTTEQRQPVKDAVITIKETGKTPRIERTPNDGSVLNIRVEVHGQHHVLFEALLPNGKNYSVTLHGPGKSKHRPGPLPANARPWTGFIHGLKGGNK